MTILNDNENDIYIYFKESFEQNYYTFADGNAWIVIIKNTTAYAVVDKNFLFIKSPASPKIVSLLYSNRSPCIAPFVFYPVAGLTSRSNLLKTSLFPLHQRDDA